MRLIGLPSLFIADIDYEAADANEDSRERKVLFCKFRSVCSCRSRNSTLHLASVPCLLTSVISRVVGMQAEESTISKLRKRARIKGEKRQLVHFACANNHSHSLS